MTVDSSQARRLEWKYCVPSDLTLELAGALESRTRPDAYSTANGVYHVRSLYYDTPDLRFYHERKDGLSIRRKLRVRNYGAEEYFLEIKRKIDQIVVKERVAIHGSRLADALDGADLSAMMAGRPHGDLRTAERFRTTLKTLGLVPTLLMTYERRAMIGRDEPDLRITLDGYLRGRTRPGADALVQEGLLFEFETRDVLELKFSGRPPRWLMDIVAKFCLKRVPYSKYCEGIDRCPMDDAPEADVGGGTLTD